MRRSCSEEGEDGFGGGLEGGLDGRSEGLAEVERVGGDGDEMDPGREEVQGAGHLEGLEERGLVGAGARIDGDFEECVAIEDAEGAGRIGGGEGVDEDEVIDVVEVEEDVDAGGLEVSQGSAGREGRGSEDLEDAGAEGVVAHEGVAEAGDEGAHWI
jgi:hypothetical protein